jgi:hypothetical protein
VGGNCGFGELYCDLKYENNFFEEIVKGNYALALSPPNQIRDRLYMKNNKSSTLFVTELYLSILVEHSISQLYCKKTRDKARGGV